MKNEKIFPTMEGLRKAAAGYNRRAKEVPSFRGLLDSIRFSSMEDARTLWILKIDSKEELEDLAQELCTPKAGGHIRSICRRCGVKSDFPHREDVGYVLVKIPDAVPGAPGIWSYMCVDGGPRMLDHLRRKEAEFKVMD